MQPDQEHAPTDVVAVANAVLECKRRDPLASAAGLALFAQVLLDGADEGSRTALALIMLRLAFELDSDIFSLLRWH